MKKLILALVVLLSSCGASDWTMFKGPFFDFTVPPGFTQKQQTKNLLVFEGDTGKVTLTWSQDQYSMINQPAHEAVEGNPGDKLLVSEPQTLGKNKVWYSEIQGHDGKWFVYLTLPLDKGELRVEAISSKDIIDIRQSVRSVTITHETYFSYPR